MKSQNLHESLTRFPFESSLVNRLRRENRWTPAHTARAIAEYKRFVYLAVVSPDPVSPSEAVDKVWHAHLFYTRSYWQDLCANLLGRPLHHDPSTGGNSETAKFNSMYEATKAFYRLEFGEEPPTDLSPPTAERFEPARNWSSRNPFGGGGSNPSKLFRWFCLCWASRSVWARYSYSPLCLLSSSRSRSWLNEEMKSVGGGPKAPTSAVSISAAIAPTVATAAGTAATAEAVAAEAVVAEATRLLPDPSDHRAMVDLAQIQAAAARIAGSVSLSPQVRSEELSQLTGNDIYLKLDNLQMTGSFKERGALNKILTLSPEEAARGVICASAGNHAQAVSYHATKRGIRAFIYMPLHTPRVKVTATRRYGAEVILHGSNYDDAFAEARRRADSDNLTFLHAFDDPAVIAGQGTLGLEMLAQEPTLEAIVCPIGGGGLIGGLACAVKSIRPEVRIIGVQTARLPSMRAALEHREPVTIPRATTVADGIAVRRAGDHTYPLVRRYVDSIVTVEEEEIAKAILLLLEREKTLAEGAGAAALAAVLHDKTGLTGRRIGVLVCGGNIDVTLLSRIIERGLVKDGRLVRLRIHLPDHPGSLHRLTHVITENDANIVETLHDRAYYGVNLGDTVIDITMETRGPEHIASLMQSLLDAGFPHDRVL